MNKYTLIQGIIACAIMVLVTIFVRGFPFAFFSRKGKEPNKVVLYLGDVLPPAMMALLLVYCLKDIFVIKYPYGIPEIICVLVAIVLHKLKRNTFLSISVSTILYMFFVQVVFV